MDKTKTKGPYDNTGQEEADNSRYLQPVADRDDENGKSKDDNDIEDIRGN